MLHEDEMMSFGGVLAFRLFRIRLFRVRLIRVRLIHICQSNIQVE